MGRRIFSFERNKNPHSSKVGGRAKRPVKKLMVNDVFIASRAVVMELSGSLGVCSLRWDAYQQRMGFTPFNVGNELVHSITFAVCWFGEQLVCHPKDHCNGCEQLPPRPPVSFLRPPETTRALNTKITFRKEVALLIRTQQE
ncbi:hypothetical protein B0H14DRAFT_2586698 [Mycena olivaceomarginata]|nr:hypothetical protein B0H14DRAFT_2586698 [Mycena olivaceomarginata]